MLNLIIYPLYYLSKLITGKDKINWLVDNFGTSFFLVHSLPAEKIEQMVQEFSQASGLKMDWFYIGGRALIKYVGSRKVLKQSLRSIQVINTRYQTEYYQAQNQTKVLISQNGTRITFYSDAEIRQRIESLWEYNLQNYLT